MRYIIVGSGAAGIAALEAIRQRDSRGEVMLITDERYGYYSRPGLAYLLTGEIHEQQLYPFAPEDFQRLNVRRVHARVMALYPSEHEVEFHNGSHLGYDRLLIATGAQAAEMRVPGIELNGVVKLDNLEDARGMLKHMGRRRTGVVVGGGITALELVEGMRARGVQTHYFLRGDRYWSNVLDETESQIVEHKLREEGVKIHYHTELEEVLGKRGKVVAVRTKDGRQIRCDLVAIAIGVRPRKELAEAAGLQVERGILVNEYLQTSVPDVYAAGDVAQVYDPLTGKSVVDSLWGPARQQGQVAGENMAGRHVPYCKSVPMNVTRLANLTTTIIGTVGRGDDADLLGIARGDSETWRQLPDAIAAQSDFDVNRLRVLVGKDYILGAIVMGDQTLSNPLYQIVSGRIDITPIREALLAPDARLGEILTDFWTHWKQTHADWQQS